MAGTGALSAVADMASVLICWLCPFAATARKANQRPGWSGRTRARSAAYDGNSPSSRGIAQSDRRSAPAVRALGFGLPLECLVPVGALTLCVVGAGGRRLGRKDVPQPCSDSPSHAPAGPAPVHSALCGVLPLAHSPAVWTRSGPSNVSDARLCISERQRCRPLADRRRCVCFMVVASSYTRLQAVPWWPGQSQRIVGMRE